MLQTVQLPVTKKLDEALLLRSHFGRIGKNGLIGERYAGI